MLRYDRGTAGLQRAEVQLRSTAFVRHRHAEYALGITTSGVQTFRYRGARQVCLPGQLHLLHPDEPHDGAPLDDQGLQYRIVYIAPEVVRDASAVGRLPFVSDPVHPARGAAASLGATLALLLRDIDDPVDDLTAAAAASTISAGLLLLAGGSVPTRPTTIDLRAVRLAADYLTHHPAPTAAGLEHISGLDRYTMTRHFKAAYGTTPDRYRLHRQLERARNAIRLGHPLAAVAVEAGFADQSHLTRHFKRTYGLTPGRWRGLSHRRSAAGPAEARSAAAAGRVDDRPTSRVLMT